MNLKYLAVAILVLICSQSFADSGKDPLWGKKNNAQIAWQNGLAQLLISKAPRFKELIKIQRDLQLIGIEISNFRYNYLLEKHPDRIKRNEGFMVFINFDWIDEDEAYLLESNEKYRQLTTRKKELKELNNEHPMRPDFRKAFDETQNTSEEKELFKKLMDTRKEIELELKSKNDR